MRFFYYQKHMYYLVFLSLLFLSAPAGAVTALIESTYRGLPYESPRRPNNSLLGSSLNGTLSLSIDYSSLPPFLGDTGKVVIRSDFETGALTSSWHGVTPTFLDFTFSNGVSDFSNTSVETGWFEVALNFETSLGLTSPLTINSQDTSFWLRNEYITTPDGNFSVKDDLAYHINGSGPPLKRERSIFSDREAGISYDGQISYSLAEPYPNIASHDPWNADVNSTPRKLVFLDFDSDTPWSYENFSVIPGRPAFAAVNGGSLPSSSSLPVQGILDELTAAFDSLGLGDAITFTTEKPIDGEYETIYFSSASPTVARGHAPDLAGGIDRFDSNKSGSAVIFSDTIKSLARNDGRPSSTDARNIAKTVAHELGHLMGLRHIDPSLDRGSIMSDELDLERPLFFASSPYDISDDSTSGQGISHNPAHHLLLSFSRDSNLVGGEWDDSGSIVSNISAAADSDNWLNRVRNIDLKFLVITYGENDEADHILGSVIQTFTLDSLLNGEVELSLSPAIPIQIIGGINGINNIIMSTSLDGAGSLFTIPAGGSVQLNALEYHGDAFSVVGKTTLDSIRVPEPSAYLLLIVGALPYYYRRHALREYARY